LAKGPFSIKGFLKPTAKGKFFLCVYMYRAPAFNTLVKASSKYKVK
jgi:hypothetical protein